MSDVKMVKLREATDLLPHTLTHEELIQAGAALAGVVQDIESEGDRQAEIKSDMKARLTKLEAERTSLSLKVSRRREMRETKVEIWLDAEKSEVFKVRPDTGEEIMRRPAQPGELQTTIPDAML
jgi:hypothetical protein